MKKTHLFATVSVVSFLFMVLPYKLQAQGHVCEADSSGLIPLNDLGAGFYEGFQGGLYPFGANSENPASTHYKKGKSTAKNLKPLDTLGNINFDNGAIVMAGFGPSIPGQLIDEFVPIVRDTLDNKYYTNPCFDAINLCVGGKGLDYATGDQSNKYWNGVVDKVYEKGYHPLQVQVGWMYFNDKYDSLLPPATFPESADAVTDLLVEYVHLMMDQFPNMKILFVSGRHYGGFADTTLDQYPVITEPSSYWNNFSVKWLIERQITGDPALKFYGAGIEAPFITWGPYYWADGNIPRTTDGRLYECDDFSEDDGYHLTDSTYERDADYLMEHIYNSDFGKNYVKDGAAWSSCVLYHDSTFRTQPEQLDINPVGITLYPNPASENIYIYRANATGKLFTVEIRNTIGQLVYQETKAGVDVGSNPVDVSGLTNGIYFIRTLIEDNETKIIQWYEGQFIKQ